MVAEEEGSNVLVCVDAYEIYQDNSLPPFPITVDLRVLPQSTASGTTYNHLHDIDNVPQFKSIY